MKISIIHPEPAYPTVSGGQNRTWNIAKHFAKKNDVTFLAYTGKIAQNSQTNIHNINYVLRKHERTLGDKLFRRFVKYTLLDRYFKYKNHPFFYPSYVRFPRKLDSDLIITVHSYHFLPTWLAMRNKKIPLILDQQNVESDLFPGTLKAEKFALKHADFVTCCSEEDRRKMIAMVPAVADKSMVIENGVDTAAADAAVSERSRIRTELGVTDDDVVFCFHGSYKYHPNTEAFEYILDTLQGFNVILFGRDCPKERRGTIQSIGCVDDPLAYIHACDVGIVPLTKGSGTRLKILEYLACSKPVISTPKGAEGLLVQDGTDILLAPRDEFKEKMRYLQEHAELRKRLGDNGRMLVEKRYEWEAILEKYERVVEGVW
ncbi:glycosyltransferase family 4 protein, partial [Patescibacteria group bacterium]|nr:glycosyltransferase family 4 protein [Patescibacteria group bacterium]